MHSIIRIIRDDADSAGGCCPVLGTPPKTLIFGRRGEMRQTTLKPIRKSFAPYKGGPAQNVCKSYARGRRHGAHGLIPEGKPCGLGLRPDHVRWPDLHLDDSIWHQHRENPRPSPRARMQAFFRLTLDESIWHQRGETSGPRCKRSFDRPRMNQFGAHTGRNPGPSLRARMSPRSGRKLVGLGRSAQGC